MSESKDFDMSTTCFARDLRIGCIRLGCADSLPLASAFVDLAKTEASIAFWAPRPNHGMALRSSRLTCTGCPQAKPSFKE